MKPTTRKPPYQPNYLVMNPGIDVNHYIHKFMDPSVVSKLGRFKEVRGNLQLTNDVKVFEHLRVGMTDACAGMMWWDPSSDSLNSGQPRLPSSVSWLDANKLSLVSIPDGVSRNALHMMGIDPDSDGTDWYQLPEMDISGKSTKYTVHLKYYEDYVERNEYFSTLWEARDEMCSKLESKLELGGFDAVIADTTWAKPMLPPMFGGTFTGQAREEGSQDITEDYMLDSSEVGDNSLEKACTDVFTKGVFDTNFGIVSDNRDMYNRLGDSQNSGLVFLAESPEILKLMYSIIHLGTTLISPKRWPSSFTALRRAVGRTHLEIQFGVLPTYSDLVSIAEGLANLTQDRFRIPVVSKVTYSATKFSSDSLYNCVTTPGAYSDPRWGYFASPLASYVDVSSDPEWPEVYKSDEAVYYTRPLAYQRQKIYVPAKDYSEFLRKTEFPLDVSASLLALLRDWGVGSTDSKELLRQFAYLVWEMIPFSWLVDYFVNVQDYLTYLGSLDDALVKFVQGSSVRFAGVEFGIIQSKQPERLTIFDDMFDTSPQMLPIAHYGVREFRRQSECQLLRTLPDLKLDLPSLRQTLNIGALLMQR